MDAFIPMLLDVNSERDAVRDPARSVAEQERLAVLDEYDILDTPDEEIFDRITRLARRLFDVDMSMITFVDGHRQWFKSRQGADHCEGPRDTSFCNQAMRCHGALIVNDAATDERFRDNPLVTGEPHIRFYAGVPLYAYNGQPLGTFCIVDKQPAEISPERFDILRDLAGMTNAALELRRLATVDPLTGAQTRRAFIEELRQGLALASRHGHDISLLTFDIDHFKRVNDTYGHHAGDAVLSETLRVCQSLLRDSDVVGRVGGEEFAVPLPHTNGADAMGVAEKLRGAIEAAALVIDGAPIRVTASFGVASGKPTEDAGHLLEIADKALYAAKRAGRNRCAAAHHRPAAGTDIGRRVLKAGLIVFNRGSLTVECTVRRLSSVGADLHVSENVQIPESFKLRIDSDGISKLCHIISRDGPRISAAFG